MGGFSVYKVVLYGPQEMRQRETQKGLGREQEGFLRGKTNVRAEIYLRDKNGHDVMTTVRISDFANVPLNPIDPNSFEQTFVAQSVVKHAEELMVSEPKILSPGRVRSAGDDLNSLWQIDKPEELKKFTNEDGSFNFEKFFASIAFDVYPTDAMFMVETAQGQPWPEVELVPYDNFPISPAAGVLNYGQGAFEGIKAFYDENGNIVIFRYEKNAERMQQASEKLRMPSVPSDYFMNAVREVVLANLRWIPKHGGSLYIRPVLIGYGPVLGVKPTRTYKFIVFCTPVGPYFKGGMNAIHLKAETEFHRSAPGLVGYIKAIGNYAVSLYPGYKAKSQVVLGQENRKPEEQEHYSEVLYLSAGKDFNKNIEEVGAANFFGIVKRKARDTFFDIVRDIFSLRLKGLLRKRSEYILYTPDTETILPGITRDSVIQLAQELGIEVRKGKVSLKFIFRRAVGAFCTGTAAVISPIRSITLGKKMVAFEKENAEAEGKTLIGVHPLARRLYGILTGIQENRLNDVVNLGLRRDRAEHYAKKWVTPLREAA